MPDELELLVRRAMVLTTELGLFLPRPTSRVQFDDEKMRLSDLDLWVLFAIEIFCEKRKQPRPERRVCLQRVLTDVLAEWSQARNKVHFRSTISKKIARLEDLGLIVRTLERRRLVLSLTSKGFRCADIVRAATRRALTERLKLWEKSGDKC